MLSAPDRCSMFRSLPRSVAAETTATLSATATAGEGCSSLRPRGWQWDVGERHRRGDRSSIDVVWKTSGRRLILANKQGVRQMWCYTKCQQLTKKMYAVCPRVLVTMAILFVQPNAQAEGLEVHNVKDFGAIGDGNTDDTGAIQSAIDSAEIDGGIVFVPPGTYLVSPGTGLSMKSNVHLLGAGRGSIFKVPNGANITGNLLKVENRSGVVISDLVLDGNRGEQSGSTNYGLYVAASQNCKINSVWTESFAGVGNQVYDSDGVLVTDCTSTGNLFHGFEGEQTRGCVWKGNRGYGNDRHGILISPGEVEGTGAQGNIIIGNSFDDNEQYGIAIGIAAAPGSELLSTGNMIANNSVRNNAQYGISLYYQDGNVVTGNLIEGNGFIGIYGFKTRYNQIIGNRLHNNSQAVNGGYDEILLEGGTSGRASRDNLISNNVVFIDGETKSRWAIREAAVSDGPNVIIDNVVPRSGTSGKLKIQNRRTALSSPAGVYQVRGGQPITGANAGIDNAFNVLRLYSNLPNSEVQVVSEKGGVKLWSNGTERLLINADGSVSVNSDTLRVVSPKTPASADAACSQGDLAWDSDYIYVCVAANSWKRARILGW